MSRPIGSVWNLLRLAPRYDIVILAATHTLSTLTLTRFKICSKLPAAGSGMCHISITCGPRVVLPCDAPLSNHHCSLLSHRYDQQCASRMQNEHLRCAITRRAFNGRLSCGKTTLNFARIVKKGMWRRTSDKVMDVAKKNEVYLKVE